jgi:Ca2+/Na+ antiporter
LVLERTEREEDRGKTLDSKVTTLLGGVVAFIGFSFRVNASVWSAGAALLYFIPLAVLFDALLTKRGKRAPTAESLTKYFPAYPVSTLKESVDAMLIADAANERINDRKAVRVDIAAIMTGIVTIVVLITQFALALEPANVQTGSPQAKAARVPVAAGHGGASRGQPHGPNHP